MNKAKECASASTLLQKKKNIAIRKLTREKNKTDLELSKLKTKFSNQIRVLESKYKQAIASKQAMSQALKNKAPQPRRTVVKTKQSQLSLEVSDLRYIYFQLKMYRSFVFFKHNLILDNICVEFYVIFPI